MSGREHRQLRHVLSRSVDCPHGESVNRQIGTRLSVSRRNRGCPFHATPSVSLSGHRLPATMATSIMLGGVVTAAAARPRAAEVRTASQRAPAPIERTLGHEKANPEKR